MKSLTIIILLVSLGKLSAQKTVVDSAKIKIEKFYNRLLSDSLRNRLKAQIVHMNKYIAQDSINSKAFLQRGIYYSQLGLQVEAISDYDRSLALDSNESVAYFNRGLAKARFIYSYEACYDLKKAHQLGIEQAENIYKTYCKLYLKRLDQEIVIK